MHSVQTLTSVYTHVVCRYVIGGVRKKMNVEWNFPSTIATAKSLPTTPINSLPSNLRQLSNTNISNEHRKIIPKSLNSGNMTISSTALHSRASNIIASRNTQLTRPLLPTLVPTSNSQGSFNAKKLNGQYKENMLNHSATSKVSAFGPFPDAIQSLAHNKLLKAILPASSQIFKLSSASELKSSQCIASTNNCSTSTSSKSVTLNANLLNLISYKTEANNTTSQHQDHVNKNSSKICCFWEDCKR